MPKTTSAFGNLNSMKNNNFRRNRPLGALYQNLRVRGFTNTYEWGCHGAQAEHRSCFPSSGEALSRGEVESPPLPKAPFPRSLLSGPLQRAVGQAHPHQVTVVLQQLEQLLVAAVSLAACPWRVRGALVLLLEGTTQEPDAKGQRGLGG